MLLLSYCALFGSALFGRFRVQPHATSRMLFPGHKLRQPWALLFLVPPSTPYVRMQWLLASMPPPNCRMLWPRSLFGRSSHFRPLLCFSSLSNVAFCFVSSVFSLRRKEPPNPTAFVLKRMPWSPKRLKHQPSPLLAPHCSFPRNRCRGRLFLTFKYLPVAFTVIPLLLPPLRHAADVTGVAFFA